MAAPLASAAELDLHLRQSVTPDVAELALAGASGIVRSYCGWDLLRDTTTFSVQGHGGVVLTLPTLHLNAVTAVRVAGLPVDLTASPAPVVHPRGQLFWAGFWPSDTLIEVDADHGYTTTPDVVRLVALTLAARIISNPEDARVASTGSVSRTYDSTLTALDMRLLDAYRL